VLTGRRAQLWAIHLGAMLGPFGANLVAPMVPELRETFSTSTEAIGLGITVYHVTFASFLLVSGTLGERFGRRRVARAFLFVFAAGSLGVIVAPTLWWFLAARAIQGMANAFVTPLLIAGLAEITPPERLGRAVGIYSSFQGAGVFLAPSVGGLAAEIDWRLAFAANAALALTLTVGAPPGDPRPDAAMPPIRPLFTPRLGLLAAAAVTSTAGALGIGYLVSVHARDVLGLSASAAGLLLAVAGLISLSTGPTLGSLVDRVGGRRAGIVAAGAGGVLCALLGAIGTIPAVIATWLALAVATALGLVAVQSLATSAVPDNRGGAVSAILSFRFAGYAISPLLWLPLHTVDPTLAFLGAGLLMAPTALALAAMARFPAETPRSVLAS
jgi:MFS family permease